MTRFVEITSAGPAAFDLTGSYRDAAELAECSHRTVAKYVQAREQGRLVLGAAAPRASVIDEFMPKLEEQVDRSQGKIRADVAHEKLVAMGFAGSERTTRRAVAELKRAWRAGNRRVFRPWVPEPGMWAQYDFGDGPRIGGARAILFCLWLAWCRFRVVLPLLDKSAPSVYAAIDTALRRIGGAPTYLLTDNEKTVTVEHVAGIPVRNPGMAAFARHYLLTVATCLPADPATKGGSEATVRIAKADLVPTDANLLGDYRSFAELEAACAAFCDEVNARPHRVTRRAPAEMLVEERARPLRRGPVHGGVRRAPAGRGEHADGRIRGRVVLGAARAGRADGVGSPPRRAGGDHTRRRGRAGRGRPARRDDPRQPQGRRGAFPARAGRPGQPRPEAEDDWGGGVFGDRGGRGAVAD
jgi:hypothetical protein